MAKILIVDDDEDILGLVQMQLRKAGHQVMTAGSGPSALKLIAERGGPDLAVLDVGLPGMDGLDLLDAIRGHDGLATLPAVFLSARVLPEDLAKGQAKGATYLTKPFVSSALLSAVAKALDEGTGNLPDPGGW